MTETVERLLIEHLRHIHGRVDQIAGDVVDLKHRMSTLEFAITLVKREMVNGEETDARQQLMRNKTDARRAGPGPRSPCACRSLS